MHPRQLALAAVLAFAAVGAQAQTKPELAQRILAAQQGSIENIGRALAAQTSQQVLEAAGQALQQVAADKRDAVGKAIEADVKRCYDDVEPVLKTTAVKLAPGTVGTLLEEKFSEDELKQILAWVDSPTSRKYQQITGDMQQTAEAIGRQLGLGLFGPGVLHGHLCAVGPRGGAGGGACGPAAGRGQRRRGAARHHSAAQGRAGAAQADR